MAEIVQPVQTLLLEMDLIQRLVPLLLQDPQMSNA